MSVKATPDSVQETVIEALKEFGVEGDIGRDTPLEELGVDSLDLVELVQIIEEKYGVEIRGDDAAAFKTVGSVIDGIVEHASAMSAS
jgi:acyl carrier protein